MEREDDGVARLERDEGLEDRGRGRVRHRGDARDHADRLGDLDDAREVVAADHADRLEVGHRVRHVLAREDVLGGLVLEDSAPGLLDRELREAAVLVEGRDGRLLHDAVDVLLGEGVVLLERLEAPVDEGVDLGDSGEGLARAAHVGSSSSDPSGRVCVVSFPCL
ncbi:hypothetical protein D3C74_379200 [compost metagenome]